LKAKKLAYSLALSIPLTQDLIFMKSKGKPNESPKPKSAKKPKNDFGNKKDEIKTRISALKKIIGQLNIDNKTKTAKD